MLKLQCQIRPLNVLHAFKPLKGVFELAFILLKHRIGSRYSNVICNNRKITRAKAE